MPSSSPQCKLFAWAASRLARETGVTHLLGCFVLSLQAISWVYFQALQLFFLQARSRQKHNLARLTLLTVSKLLQGCSLFILCWPVVRNQPGPARLRTAGSKGTFAQHWSLRQRWTGLLWFLEFYQYFRKEFSLMKRCRGTSAADADKQKECANLKCQWVLCLLSQTSQTCWLHLKLGSETHGKRFVWADCSRWIKFGQELNFCSAGCFFSQVKVAGLVENCAKAQPCWRKFWALSVVG